MPIKTTNENKEGLDMYAQVEKQQENISRANADPGVHKKSTIQHKKGFIDDRPSVKAQQNLIDALQKSSVVKSKSYMIMNKSSQLKEKNRIFADRPLQRMFELKTKEFYSEKDIISNSNLKKYLTNLGAGYLKAAVELALDDNESPEFKTENTLKLYLEKNYQSKISSGTEEEKEEGKIFTDLLESIGEKEMEPTGWGHTFSNGKHGMDMAKNDGLVAKKRAKEEGKSIGVWLDNDKAKQLIKKLYAEIYKKGEIVEKLVTIDIPNTIALEYTKDGDVRDCVKVFIKINAKGIVITAYPTTGEGVVI